MCWKSELVTGEQRLNDTEQRARLPVCGSYKLIEWQVKQHARHSIFRTHLFARN